MSRPWPTPAGPHLVGSIDFEITDFSRTAAYALEAANGRRLRVTAWYPASSQEGLSRRMYLKPRETEAGVMALFALIQAPEEQVADLVRQATAGWLGAKPLDGRWPTLVFCHGGLSYPAQNTLLCEHLASHGYAVFSLSHPHEASSYVLGDGTLVEGAAVISDELTRWGADPSTMAIYFGDLASRRSAIPLALKSMRANWLGRLCHVWAADNVFLVDCLEDGAVPDAAKALATVADPTRSGYFGMSYGGHVAALSCIADVRVKAGVDIDGGFFTAEMVGRDAGAPFLILTQDIGRTAAQLGFGERQPVTPDAMTMHDLTYQRDDGAPPTHAVHRTL